MTRALIEAEPARRLVTPCGNGRVHGIEDWLPLARTRSYRAGETIFTAREPLVFLGIVQEGIVKVYNTSLDDKIMSKLAVGGIRDVLLGVEGFDGVEVHESSAQALTACKVLYASFDHIEEQGRMKPELILELAKLVAQSTRTRQELLPRLRNKDVRTRTAQVILDWSVLLAQNNVNFSQQLMAELIGTCRESVGEAEQELRRLGLIRMVRGRIEIVEGKEKELEQIASGRKEVHLNGKTVAVFPASK